MPWSVLYDTRVGRIAGCDSGCRKSHPITAAIARMHPDDQDVIDDFLLEIATRGLTLKGQFLSHLIRHLVPRWDFVRDS